MHYHYPTDDGFKALAYRSRRDSAGPALADLKLVGLSMAGATVEGGVRQTHQN